MARRRKVSKIGGAFVTHSLEMRRSPAWRALPDNARRVLDRLEVEHMTSGATLNGALICTYDDFAKAGIRRASVPLALRQAEALGFVVRQKGYRTSGDVRAPSLYRLTYVFGVGKSPDPSNDWRNIGSDNEAAALLRSAEPSPPREL